tara:strand:+ start:1359 stop:1571 length:213 start_codon:yes stop_codon:yes gene_type:complete
MNREQKGQKYDWLLDQYKIIERQINQVPKRPLEETLQDLDSKEYNPKNQEIVNQLTNRLRMIDEEVKRLF